MKQQQQQQQQLDGKQFIFDNDCKTGYDIYYKSGWMVPMDQVKWGLCGLVCKGETNVIRGGSLLGDQMTILVAVFEYVQPRSQFWDASQTAKLMFLTTSPVGQPS